MNSRGRLGNRASSFISSLEIIRHEPKKEIHMRVKVKNDYVVYLDGISPSRFPAGETVDLPLNIAQVLLEDGRATIPGAPEDKSVTRAPENKREPDPSQNKGGKVKKG